MEQEQERIKQEKAAAEAEASGQGSKRSDKDKHIRFAASVKANQSFGPGNDRRRTQPILSDEHEQTQKFSSVTGNTFTQTKALEKEQSFFLSNNKGIALVFSPNEGELPANSEVPITLTIYNNVCGKFDDNIVARVNGLDSLEFPVRINISGSPVVIPNNQVGLNYNTIPPSLGMPTIVSNSNAISKTFKIKNTGIRTLQVDWQIFDKADMDKVENDAFKLSIIRNQSYDKKRVPFRFDWKALEPEES